MHLVLISEDLVELGSLGAGLYENLQTEIPHDEPSTEEAPLSSVNLQLSD